jgi:hypothetical protein
MLIDQVQAFALTLGEQPHKVIGAIVPCAHRRASKRRLGAYVYFNEKG